MGLFRSIFIPLFFSAQRPSMKARIVFCFMLLICSNASFAQGSSEQLHALSAHPQWQKLLHINASRNDVSYINSNSFFLSSKRDNINPHNELLATINAMTLPVSGDTNQHAQCKFPARLIFLKQHLDNSFNAMLPNVQCEQYKAWRLDANISSISVVFASGYMSNPASMYGHLFVKLNRSKKQSDLLNYSLNYGAIIPDNENPVVYILKGIFGGYDAAYSDKQFFRHQHNYGEVELRDLWDYKLALSSADIDLLVAHIWELLPNKFDYFFIDENCAFHIAKLLELVLTEPIISDQSLWVLPSAVAKGIAENSYADGALLDSVTFIPSRESVLNQKFSQLALSQQQIGTELISNAFEFSQSKNYQRLTDSDKAQLIESLFSFHEVNKRLNPEQPNLKVNRRKLIRERLSLPSGRQSGEKQLTNKVAPHQGMPVSKVSLGTLHHDSEQNFITAGFRMTYFDDLSTDKNQTKFSNLEMLDVELIANDDTTKVLRLDLVDIDSLYKESIQWTDQHSWAWSVRTGFEQLQNNCIDCGIYFGEGEIGKSYLLSNTLVYAMVGGKFFWGEEEDIASSAKIGILSEINDRLEAKFEIKQLYGLMSERSYDIKYRGVINYHFAKHWEARLFAEKAESTVVGIKFNYFWGF